MAIRVIGVGDNVVDKYMHTKTMYPGGNAFNFSAYASMLGASSSYMGVFGSDEAAQLVQATARELGIDTSHCRVEEGENGYAMITLVDGDRKFLGSNKGGVAKEKPIHFEEADLEYLDGFSLICTSINSHINPELPKLRPLKPYVAYDFSILETDEIFDAVCPHIDFAITSCGDASMEEIQRRCERIHQRGCRYVIASRGKKRVGLLGWRASVHPPGLPGRGAGHPGARETPSCTALPALLCGVAGRQPRPLRAGERCDGGDGRRQQILRQNLHGPRRVWPRQAV